MTVVYIHVVRDGPFNFQEGVMVFFLKKYSDSQYVAEKNILILVEEKNLIQSFCHIKTKINILTLVLSENQFLNKTKNHNTPCKLNGRSLNYVCFKELGTGFICTFMFYCCYYFQNMCFAQVNVS